MASHVEFTGPARLDRRTKRLTRRLKPGDVAIIDHRDIDRVSAEELVDSGARVVVNCSPSQTGRFPNPGPLLLVRGGVQLVDVDGAGALRGDQRGRARLGPRRRASTGTATASRPAARSAPRSWRARSPSSAAA